jgi:spoIIIJ-associated protein
MSRLEEFEGPTLDAVLEEAARRSGRRKEDLQYEVASEDRGFLGVGVRRIAIRVGLAATGSKRSAPATDRTRELAAVAPRPVDGAGPEPDQERDDTDAGVEEVPSGPDPTAPEVARLVATLIATMSLELSTQMTEEDDRIVVELAGGDRELLVERRGEVLDALQYVINRMARKNLGTVKRIQMESDGFRSDREDELREMAVDAAERVRRTGEPVWLPPLNPYERRIVHVTLSR